jgi:hypothetical protein
MQLALQVGCVTVVPGARKPCLEPLRDYPPFQKFMRPKG